MTRMQLTDRERQIRTLVVDGLTNDDIATRLKISRKTVESHLHMLFRKLGVSRRDQLTLEDVVPDPHPPGGATVIGLSDLEEQLRTHETAIRRITDRQTPLFSERVEIIMTIGESAGEDAVVERRWTTPKPYLIYRVTRPIIPAPPAAPLTVADLDLQCEVVGKDVGVTVGAVLDRGRRPQLLVIFQPGLEEETEWVLRYRAPGMWDPLRAMGEDKVVWRPGASEGDDTTTTSVTELTVRFIFPPDAAAWDVVERRGLGVAEDERLADGRLALIWRDVQPGGAGYEWMLKQTARR